MSSAIEPKNEAPEIVQQENKDELGPEKREYEDQPVKVLGNEDAYDGERYEHSMGTWAAAKAQPWACFWAFIFCFTIVSLPVLCLPHSGYTKHSSN